MTKVVKVQWDNKVGYAIVNKDEYDKDPKKYGNLYSIEEAEKEVKPTQEEAYEEKAKALSEGVKAGDELAKEEEDQREIPEAITESYARSLSFTELKDWAKPTGITDRSKEKLIEELATAGFIVPDDNGEE